MVKERIETGKAPQLEIAQCAGDLVIRPWAELAVQVQGSCESSETEGRLVFQAEGDLRLHVPMDSSIRVANAQGDLLIKGIRGDVALGEISGDAILQNLAKVDVSKVYGDLSAKNVQGMLAVETVMGDAVARNIDGDFSIESVHGDLAAYYINGHVHLRQGMGDVNLRTISGEVSITTAYRDVNLRNLGNLCVVKDVHGDIRLKGGLGPGEHSCSAMGDIVVRWPITAPLQLVATAPSIQNRLPLEDVKEIDDSLIGRIGDGDTAVTLNAAGRISLKEGQLIDDKWNDNQKEAFDMDFMIDLSGLGARISAEVSQSMASITKELETSFGPEFAQNISEKVSQQAEKAARKAEAAAEKARRYAEREAARAERYQRHAAYSPPPKRPAKPEPPAAKATGEEQLKILRMVEKGTISPAEAATLLEALEQ